MFIAAGIAVVFAVGAVRHMTSWWDLVNYGIVVPLAMLWELVHSPLFWIVVGQIWVLVMFNSIGRAWQTHRDQQRRIIQLLEDIDRNERASYTALAEKVEQMCADGWLKSIGNTSTNNQRGERPFINAGGSSR
ncbi:MAG: hypothetical protein WB689_12375 [Xanthobacteraceae bacterium]